MEQRTTEWFAERAGKFTGSRFSSLMALLKSGKPGAGRKNLVATLAVERIMGTCLETHQNAAMLRGIELEPIACEAYENHMMLAVNHIAFINHPTIPNVGCSPDGLMGEDGMVEIKCPSAADKHLQAHLTGAHAVEYKWQLQGQLWVADRQWVDAVSFDPRWPEALQLAIIRVERDEDMIKELVTECIKGDAEVNELVKQLKEKMK